MCCLARVNLLHLVVQLIPRLVHLALAFNALVLALFPLVSFAQFLVLASLTLLFLVHGRPLPDAAGQFFLLVIVLLLDLIILLL